MINGKKKWSKDTINKKIRRKRKRMMIWTCNHNSLTEARLRALLLRDHSVKLLHIIYREHLKFEILA